jgi:hypothetical protein
MIQRYIAFTLALVGGVLLATWLTSPPAALSEYQTDQSGRSTIKFSHRFHAEEAGLACLDCHGAAASSEASIDDLRSTHESCVACHQEQVDNSCGYCHEDPENIVPALASDHALIFSHEQHLGMEDVDCVTCHADVEKSETIAEVLLPPMQSCSGCHDNRKATSTCEACHAEFVTLVPMDHQRSDFRRNHRDVTRLGGLEASCATCHTETFCQDCHRVRELKQFGRRDLMGDPDPRRATKDDPDQLILQNVHELNYRFTHGIDAKGRQADCATCHEVQGFCVDCHQAGGNVTQLKFRPASHDLPGFTTIGRGSGGGFHAEEARRDLESCISCHDVEGQDPTCLTCHIEGGGVR